ncbi:MAG: hypothetical protein Q8P57_02710 [Candidatus Pacearchaeota archaeon]|nr:hypothetical protein [Candidatus Pacearchaeota archaeon]
MKKRGVSPVIATVLLIAIVMVLGAIIFLWARAFLSEGAIKAGKAVEISCADVNFESQIVSEGCGTNNAALDINNIGNVPIYGFVVKEWKESTGSLIVDNNIESGTITPGSSAKICLGKPIGDEDAFSVIPKLLAEDSEGRNSVYTCPEEHGIIIAYTGI